MPPDNKVRVGTCTAVGAGTATISVQGSVIKCGLLDSYVPAVGDSVVVLRGQSTWVALGSVHDSSATAPKGYVDAVTATTNALVTGVSAETSITQLALSASVWANHEYLIHIQFLNTVTVTTDDWDLRVYRDTAISGTQIGSGRFSGDDTINTHRFTFPYVSTATETLSIFFTIVRTAGTGTISIIGPPSAGIVNTWAGIEDVNGTGNWRTA
jgi:hypothetical protein